MGGWADGQKVCQEDEGGRQWRWRIANVERVAVVPNHTSEESGPAPVKDPIGELPVAPPATGEPAAAMACRLVRDSSQASTADDPRRAQDQNDARAVRRNPTRMPNARRDCGYARDNEVMD